jgi:hypothetical protein
LDNLALACSGCNGFKHQRSHGIDPVTYQPARLFHPRQDRWTDHFDWDEDFARIIGKTEIGRATIESLQMNRAGVVNLRALLHQAGKHPPE